MPQDEPKLTIRDHYVVLAKQANLDVATLTKAVEGLGIGKAEVRRCVRRQRGLVFGKQSLDRACEIAEALTIAGIDAIATHGDDLFLDKRPRRVMRVEVMDDGFYFPSAASLGERPFIPADDVTMLSFALINARETSTSSADPIELAKALHRADDALHHPPAFPLAGYLLQAPEDALNLDRLAAGKSDKKKKKKRGVKERMSRFEEKEEIPRYKSEHPKLKGRCFIATARESFVLEAETAVFERRDESSMGHWIRPFYALASDALAAIAHCYHVSDFGTPEEAESALFGKGCVIPKETLRFAMAHDDASYVFEDLEAFEENLAWWRTNAQV